MAFTTTPTADGGVLVEGTDSKGVDGTTVLRSESWTQVQNYLAFKAADEEYAVTVKDFFGPLVKAAEAREAALAKPKNYSTITVTEATTGINAEPAYEVELDAQGTVLRALSEGKDNLLRWVNGELIVLQA